MDHRTPLPEGSQLTFPGMTCVIDRCIGRGSNAVVYEARYPDTTSNGRMHHVLVKELFPFDPRGHIRREADLSISRDEEGEALWQTHLDSFRKGNDVHLQLLAMNPDRLGQNINTFPLNNTLYTVMDDTGSRNLAEVLDGKPFDDLRRGVAWCMQLLDCLDIFHRQNYLHLDVSLDNILLIGSRTRERVMLTDYNSVISRAEILNGESLVISEKEGFTAPETQTGMYSEISFCTDLYSVAAVFYAALTGHPPTLVQMSRKTPPDGRESPLLADASPAVKEQVRKILRRGLRTLPDKRYQSCGAMKDDLIELENLLDEQDEAEAAEDPAVQTVVAEPAQPERRGRKGLLIAVIAVLLAAIVCAVLLLLRPGTKNYGPTEKASRTLQELTAFTDTDNPEDPFYESMTGTRQSASEGDLWAIYGMGIIYEDGAAVEQDYGIARQYYLLAAEQGEPYAVYRLGIFYEYGLGVGQSMETAARYYQQAADLGLTDAQVRVGQMYLFGDQVEANDRKAFMLFQQAWDNGESNGAFWLGNMYRDGQGVTQSYPQAAALYKSAADLKNADAAEALGDLYCDSNSGMENPDAAAQYYQIAADLGSESAAEKLAALQAQE